LSGSLDVGALSALRARITGQGLTEVCPRLLGEIDRQLARAQEAGRAASPPPPTNPREAVSAEETAFNRVRERNDTCEGWEGYIAVFGSTGAFGRRAAQERDRLCGRPASPVRTDPPLAAGGTPAAALRAAQAGEAIANRRFNECAECPEMVALPGGIFTLGSPATEQGRESDEGPQIRVTLRPFAVSRFEITRSQYAAFIRETGRVSNGGCYGFNRAADNWELQQSASWQAPGFDQAMDHPVVCVSWDDAQAYVAWINGKVEGEPYRLLTESEWEYAARAGTSTRFWWGEGENDLCAYANGADQAARSRFPNWTWTTPCNDGHVFTAPVGFSGRENRFGLADMAGNVWEWTQDCYNVSYDLIPTNGAPNTTGSCANRVIRGGSWFDFPQYLRSADRDGGTPTVRVDIVGFRLSRAL